MHPNLSAAFAAQARACAQMGSPFMALLMALLPDLWPRDSALAQAVAALPGAPGPQGASIPLRVAGGLHALVLSGADPALAAVWPGGAGGNLAPAVVAALLTHDAHLAQWVRLPPQTNEVGRSAPLAAAARVVAAQTGMALHLLELGASAGLNLLFDRHAPGLDPRWTGPQPPDAPLTVLSRRGVDLNPLSPDTDALRLRAYVWPDQPVRMARLTAALGIATANPTPVDQADAAAWLEARLAAPAPQGAARLVFHTIAFQYFPAATQARIMAALTLAGAQATDQSPLAHIAMEGDATPGSAALTLQIWPGSGPRLLARTGFHGEWIDWRG